MDPTTRDNISLIGANASPSGCNYAIIRGRLLSLTGKRLGSASELKYVQVDTMMPVY